MRIKLTWYSVLRDHPQFTAYLALVLLCFFWGTTYLGIRIALESFPPAVLMSTRYLFSGGLMLIGAKLSGARLPRGRELWITAGLGLAILGLGNGSLTYAEQWVPSGLAALFITTAPFWYAMGDALLPKGSPLHAPTIRGMLIGTVGVILLAGPAAWNALVAPPQTGFSLWTGFVLLQGGQAAWSIASLLQRRQASQVHPFVTGAIQQLAIGIALAAPAAWSWPSAHWNLRGILALLYLAIFGGIVGYSCFTLVMARLPVSIATIYTYVNPVVAVILGALVYREPFGIREAIAVVFIFAGVFLVRRASFAAQQAGAQRAAESRQQTEEGESGHQDRPNA